MLPFPGREGQLCFYHHSFYGSAVDCSMESIEELFRKGVDDTIRMFCESYDTCKFQGLYYGGTLLGRGREVRWEGTSCTGLRSGARFLHVERGEEQDAV